MRGAPLRLREPRVATANAGRGEGTALRALPSPELCVEVDARIFALTSFGGLIRYWTNLLTRLPEHGVAVDLGIEGATRLPERIANLSSASTDVDRSMPRVFHSTYFTPPPEPRVSVVTVHDLIYEDDPEIARQLDPCDDILEQKRLSITEADAIVTPSEVTRDRLRYHYPDIDVPVHVIPHGIDPVFLRPMTSPGGVRHRSGGRRIRPYLLHVGGRRLYKNFVMVLERYLDSSLPGEFDLVAVGSERDPLPGEGELIAGHAGGTQVRLVGPVGDGELVELITGAAAVVSGSSSEGFGLPLIEAIAVGTPVVCSDIPVHRETVGGLASFFSLTDPSTFAAAVADAVDSGSEDRAGRVRVIRERHDWDAGAASLVSVYRSVLAGEA